MYASFVIRTGEPVRATAVPVNAVVREGDGTMTVWVTNDRRHFVKRIVEIGLQRDGYDQILKRLAARRTDRNRRCDVSEQLLALNRCD